MLATNSFSPEYLSVFRLDAARTAIGLSSFDTRMVPLPEGECPGDLQGVIHSLNAEEVLHRLVEAFPDAEPKSVGSFLELNASSEEVLKNCQHLAGLLGVDERNDSANSLLSRVQWLLDNDSLSGCDENETIKQLEILYHEQGARGGLLLSKVLVKFATQNADDLSENFLAQALSILLKLYREDEGALEFDDVIEILSLSWYLKGPQDALPAWLAVCEQVTLQNRDKFSSLLRGPFGQALQGEGSAVIREYSIVFLRSLNPQALRGAQEGGPAGRSIIWRIPLLRIMVGGMVGTALFAMALRLLPKELSSAVLISVLVGGPMIALVAKRFLKPASS